MSCQTKYLCIFASVFVLVGVAHCQGSYERPCISSLLEQCSSTETCIIQPHFDPPENIHEDPHQPGNLHPVDGICKCRRNTKRNAHGLCEPIENSSHQALPTPAPVTNESSSSSIAAGVLIPLFLVGLVILVIVGRRYRWLERLRQPRIRHHDTALVGAQDDLDDDPPIA